MYLNLWYISISCVYQSLLHFNLLCISISDIFLFLVYINLYCISISGVFQSVIIAIFDYLNLCCISICAVFQSLVHFNLWCTSIFFCTSISAVSQSEVKCVLIWSGASQSSCICYVSLLFSDWKLILSNWLQDDCTEWIAGLCLLLEHNWKIGHARIHIKHFLFLV